MTNGMENKAASAQEPVLLVLAAGMGSRYGGLKQIDPVGKHGEILLDFSLYDARLAGFKKAVFIIKEENLEDFRALMDEGAGKHMEIAYVYQSLSRLPEGFSIPDQRVKPWGTGHAVLCAAEAVHAPFAVINADDYYGRDAFARMYAFLKQASDGERYDYSMVGFLLNNTLTPNGSVSRGVCSVKDGKMTDVIERTMIERHGDAIEYSEDQGETWHELAESSIVSMNLWGFTESIFLEIEQQFKLFLDQEVRKNPQKAEFYLPFVVNELVKRDKAEVTMLSSTEQWYGVTHQQDKVMLMEALARMRHEGKYPGRLW